MKTLHSIPHEERKFDFTKLKFPDWTLSFDQFNQGVANTTRYFDDFTRQYTNMWGTNTNYYTNIYPTSGTPITMYNGEEITYNYRFSMYYHEYL